MKRWIAAGAGLLLLAGCTSISPPSLEDICRDASRCSVPCGSMETGASRQCTPVENEGRTWG